MTVLKRYSAWILFVEDVKVDVSNMWHGVLLHEVFERCSKPIINRPKNREIVSPSDYDSTVFADYTLLLPHLIQS
ncbi:hypothetical protein RB195_011133 [Necator americanus]|uniref:Uncharacterized protein n=1 Tax=Necator americanus TaxID=51031 RepID=A0ABR1D131_NECAM